MNTFNYDTSNVNYYVTTDLGTLGDAPTSTVDNGETAADFVVSGDYIVTGDYIVDLFTEEDYQEINFTETTYPFGTFKVSNTTDSAATVVFVSKPEPIKLYQKAIVVKKQTWAGSGTLFEIADGRERMVAPWIGSSGPLRVSGGAESSVTHKFTEDSIKTYGSSVDYGLVPAAVGSSIAYGQVTDIVDEGEFDNGDILTGQGTPFGSLKIRGFKVTSNRFRSYTGSGSFSLISAGSEQFDQPSVQTYVVGSDLASGQFIRRDVIGLTISGGDGDSFTRTTYYGSGSLFDLSGGLERKVYDYNSGSVEEYSIGADNGSVGSPTSSSNIDYGQTSEQATAGEFDNGQVLIDHITYPLTGLFKITGGDSAHSRTYGEVGSGHIKTYRGQAIVNAGQASDFAFLPHWRGRGGARIFNSTIPDAFSRPYDGSGSLFEIGQKDERAVFTYSVDPIVGRIYESLGSSDAGIVDQSAGTTENYGNISSPLTNGILNYGQLTPGFFKFGNINITGGDRAHAKLKAYHGAGGFNANGNAAVQFAEPTPQVYVYGHRPQEASQGEFIKFGGGMSSIITVKGTYFGGGTLFNVGQNDERAVFDYNDSSIEVVQDPIDNGSLSSFGSTSDYGQVNQPSVGETSYGQVAVPYTIQPFGRLFEVTGGDIAHSTPKAYLGTTAEIRITGGYSNLQFTSQAGESTVLFSTSGGDADSFSRPYIGSGSLFNIGDRIEKTTYSYNISSIIEPFVFTDAESIVTSASSVADYGSVGQDVSAANIIDNGSVITDPHDSNPLGRLFSVTGTAIEKFFPKFIWDRQSPAIRIFNEQQDPADFRFRPHWRTDTTTTNPPKLRNAPDGEFNTYAQVRPFIGSGSLFHIGDKLESATYDYNESSVVEFTPGGDYGSIGSASSTNIDYGAITDVVTEGEFDNGQVLITETTQSSVGLFSFQGVGLTQFIRGPYNARQGIIRIFNEQQDPADFRFSPHWRARPYEQGKLTGNAETPRSRDFVGSGPLFSHGTKIESATVVYSQASIVEFTHGGDYGSIANASGTLIDYGTVDGIVTEGEFDNGQLVITETEYPLTGLFDFQGVGLTQFIRGPYSGKGNISISGELIEKVSSNDIALGTISFTGDAETPRSRDFVGSGSLFHIGDRIEKAVFSYNNSSITTFETTEDYQSIVSNATSSNDYGTVSSIVNEGEFDNGQLVITETTQPFGLFNITGDSIDKWHQCFTKVGSGSLFSFNGGIESRTDDYPESTVLFNFTGNLTESFSKGLYTGSGSLFHIGDRIEKAVFSYNNSSIAASESIGDEFGSITDPITTSSDYGSVANAYLPPNTDNGDLITLPGDENPFGLFSISGGSVERQIDDYVGSGSLFSTKGAAEAAVWQTPEETFLLKMRGGAVEKHIENWVGSGTIKYPEDTPLAPNAAVRFRPHWRGRAFESPITLKGVCGEFFRGSYVGNKTNVSFKILTPNEGFEWRQYRPSPRYVNSVYGKIGGSANVAGISVSQKVNVYGYYGDDRDPGTSGSLFTFNSATEVAGYNPVTDTVLYTASGVAASKWNPAWTSRPDGSPRLSGTPGLQLRFNIFTNPEVEVFKFDGTPNVNIALNYNGSGTLFTTNGSSEIRGFNPSTDTVLFRASGNPIVLFSLLHIGSGSLFGFGSAAEARTILAPESTVLFIPSGSGSANSVRAHEGSGTNIVSGTGEETRTNAYQGEGSLFSAGSAAEVTAISEAESTILFKASGGEANAFVRSAIAEGNVTISDNLDEAFARTHAGEGSLFGFNGAAEAVTVDEESTGLFNFIGDANIVRDRSFAGSGSLFGINGASEARVVSPDLETGLFEITGAALGVRTRTFIPDGGETFVYGDGGVVSTRIYSGEGSLFGIGGATESTTTNLPQNTLLYTVEGRGVVTRARDFAGSESVFISGNALPVAAVIFTGSGTLSTFNGAAESRTITSESTVLFKPSGSAAESFTEGNYNASGSATISGEASDIKNTRSERVFAYVSTSGKAIARQTYAYLGTGTFSTFNGAAEARAIDIETPVSVNLFTVVGNNPGSVTRVTQPGTAKFVLSGASVNVLKLFSPIRIFSTII